MVAKQRKTRHRRLQAASPLRHWLGQNRSRMGQARFPLCHSMQTTAILATVLFEGHVADLIGSRCIRRHAVLGDEHGRVGRRRPTRPVLTHTFLSLLPRTLQRE